MNNAERKGVLKHSVSAVLAWPLCHLSIKTDRSRVQGIIFNVASDNSKALKDSEERNSPVECQRKELASDKKSE